MVLRVSYSGAGLARIRVRTRGRLTAQSLEPLYAAGTTAVRIPIVRSRLRALRHAPLRVTVTAEVRGLLGEATVRRVRGLLR
jgi:hypothetical protein